jgi:hypothetical protein
MGKIYQFPKRGIYAEAMPQPLTRSDGPIILKPGDSWPKGIDDYRITLSCPGYYLLGYIKTYWGKTDRPTWEMFYLREDGRREFIHDITGFPWEPHIKMAEMFPGYEPGISKIGRERAIGRFYRDDNEYGIIVRPDLLLEKKDYRPMLAEIKEN